MKSSPQKQATLGKKQASKQGGFNITQIKNEKLALLNEVMMGTDTKKGRSCQKVKEASLKIPLSPKHP